MRETGDAETMQTKREGRATHNAVRFMSALIIATWLGAGCGKAEKTELPVSEAPKPVESEKWEPETVEPPETQSDHGHSHGPGDHSH